MILHTEIETTLVWNRFCEDQYLLLDSDRILAAKVSVKLYNAVKSMRNMWDNAIISALLFAKILIFL